MIVRTTADSLVLINQPDHAALSGEIMAAWQQDDFPARPTRATVLAATANHDDGWREVDAAPMVDPTDGRPYDFIGAPDSVKRSIWPRASARLGARDPAVGALVAQHALTIFRGTRGAEPWRPFFVEMERWRDGLIAEAAADWPDAGDAFLRDYRIVFLGDLLSLIFCNGWTDRFETHGYEARLEGDRLRVAPDPFGGAEVPLRIRARAIPARRYASDDDLRAALAAAEDRLLTGVAGGTDRL